MVFTLKIYFDMEKVINDFKDLDFDCNLFEYVSQIAKICDLDIYESTDLYYIINMWDKKKYYSQDSYHLLRKKL